LYQRTSHIHDEGVSNHDLLLMIRDEFVRSTLVSPAEAPTAKDMRLRTRHLDLLAALNNRPLREALA
jgi:hypothetical protein